MTVYIAKNIEQIKHRISKVAHDSNRNPSAITLLAVSKTQSVNKIQNAIKAGQFQFGENYVQEGIEKILYFQQNTKKLIWHFIGPLQSNKTRLVAEHFDWVHTINRFKIAERLSIQRPPELPPLNGLIQINISNEPNKSGIGVAELLELASKVNALPNITFRGIMAIPRATTDSNEQKHAFKELYNAFSHLKELYPYVDTLSMGMSNDMDNAIIAGSTMIRIGTKIFGTRR